MLGSVLTLLFFLAVGIGWRFLTPGGITAESLQRPLASLIHFILLPLAVFFVMLDLPLNEAALRILLYVLGTSAIGLAVAWLWLWKVSLGGKTKGALFIAAAFGNIFFLGLPLNVIFYPDWTMRVAVEYGLVANVLLLYTAGVVLSRSFGDEGKIQFKKSLALLKEYKVWLQEPLVWATLLALVLNVAGVEFPAWLKGIRSAVDGSLVALLLVSVALSLNWSKAWNTQVIRVLPAAAIQLILVPLVMWGMAELFGAAGVKTTQVLLLDSMLPATVLGFAFCDRFKLDGSSFSLAFVLTTALSVVTIPVWAKLLF
ncbi:MAG TPA: AEC family transporter [Mariprofundaceae bacterium]|nr:AEC family transporter [Mariprofundaceae bacterium]